MDDQEWVAVLPVSRGRAVARALLWLALACVLLSASWVLYTSLDWSPGVAARRLVTLCMLVAALPVPVAAFAAAVTGGRWLLLGCWPAPIGAFASERELRLRLGPFGTKAFDAASLDLRYPFDMSIDREEEGFEAFLPAREQMRRFLPRFRHPNTEESIARRITRYVVADEEVAARALRPAINRWREALGLAAPEE